jgi:glycogen debranching enzyme
MDAIVDGWVVTPRNGRAVEINALWYNAVRSAAELARRFESSDRGERLWVLAQTIHNAFSRRFWNDAAGCCFDVVDESGNDASIRPNQLLAMSLPFPVLAGDPVLSEERQVRVLETVRQHLLTPCGIRTLQPKDPSYQGHYGGGVFHRDRAYHNGSAFPWLLGHYVSALLNVRGRSANSREEARKLLTPCLERMHHDGLGLIPELFDGNPPHAPGGAIASPLAAAEFLRCFAEDFPTQESITLSQRLAGEARDVTAPSNLMSPT